MPFSLHEETPDDRTRVVGMRGDLDASTSSRLTTAIKRAVDAGANHVVVDLAETTFLDSSALASLLASARLLRRPGGVLAVVASHHAQPRGRMDMTGTGQVLNVCESREEALSLVDHPPTQPPVPNAVRFSLYIDGSSEHGQHAIEEFEELRRRYLPGAEIEVVDINDAPDRAESERLLASPTLVRTAPAPVRRIMGDLSDHPQVLHALGLDHVREELA